MQIWITKHFNIQMEICGKQCLLLPVFAHALLLACLAKEIHLLPNAADG